ncbi:VOC family protein, partial [Vibrio cholerae]|uniref:VOC family protein n=1 Tax=Vibrio cholerae TaxID=666 RepID=UPI001E5FDD23
MFSHSMFGSNVIEKAKAFIDDKLSVLGYTAGGIDAKWRCLYINQDGVLGITKPVNGELATHGNGMTIGFKVSNPELVEAWPAAGEANGGVACEVPPGIRGIGQGKLYLAYFRDTAVKSLYA